MQLILRKLTPINERYRKHMSLKDGAQRIKQSIKSQKGTWSRYYKAQSSSLVRDVLAHLEYLLRILLNFPRKALEIGCGTGFHSCLISRFGIEVIIVDIDREVVRLAMRNAFIYKAKNLNFVVCDARFLPIRDNAFDVSFSQGLLEHFDDSAIRAIISEAMRVSKKATFSVPSNNYSTKDFGDERLLTPKEWRALLSTLGVNMKVHYYTLDLQSIKNSSLSRRIPKSWHILIEISQK